MLALANLRDERRERGFGIIELLVVILIIGILAAIAIPAYLNQRKSAADASLETDLRSLATAYQGWQTNPQNTNTKFRQMIGNNNTIYLLGEGAKMSDTAPKRYWGDYPDLPSVQASKGNVIEMHVTAKSSGAWSQEHEQGEFCLQGANPDSGNYTYRGYSGQAPLGYANVLYYDSRLGRSATMDDLVSATEAGETVSCYAFANLWMNATRG